MTPRERILTALSLKEPDRVPMSFGGFNREAYKKFKQATDCSEPNPPVKYFDAPICMKPVSFKPPHEDANFYAKYHTGKRPDGKVSFNDWGTGFVEGSNPAYDHFIAPLTQIESLSQLEEYPLPDYTKQQCYEHLEEHIKEIKTRQLAAMGQLEMTIFEVAWQIRGFNELMMDFFEKKEMAAYLLDKITDIRVFMARKYAEYGVDILALGDDVGMQNAMMISPALWEEWLKPRLSKVIRAAKEVNPHVLIFYHSDGYIEPILPGLIDAGINVLNPVQPECMDPAKIKKLYGDKIAFWGTLGVQHTLPFGTPQDVRNEVKKRIETVGPGGGFVIAPTHAIAPEVPYENIFAFVEAVKEYGQYK